jgi:FkbM family methyltransferase
MYDGSYESLEARIIEATMRPDDSVVEIGCGIGFLATIAARTVAGVVHCYDANPAMVAATLATIDRNNAAATATMAVLRHNPTVSTAAFYVRHEFWSSSLTPDSRATAIEVPVLDFIDEITKHDASYLIVDIEGGETDLLLGPLPACVRRLCVECHPAVSLPAAQNAMLSSLLSQRFVLHLNHSYPPVLYFER